MNYWKKLGSIALGLVTMKYWKILGSIALGLAIVFGALFASPILGPDTAQANTCDDDGYFNLWAGQYYDAGNGWVTYTGGTTFNLYINPAAGVAIEKIDLGIYETVGDAPDPPAPGSLTYHWTYSPAEDDPITESVTVGLSAATTYVIALHADTIGATGAYKQETAWGCCNEITSGESCPSLGDGIPWAYYFTFTTP